MPVLAFVNARIPGPRGRRHVATKGASKIASHAKPSRGSDNDPSVSHKSKKLKASHADSDVHLRASYESWCVGNLDDAEEALNRALKVNPKDAEVWSNLGVFLETERRDVPTAEKTYRKAIDINPTCANAWHNLGLLLQTKKNDINGAEQAFRKAVASSASTHTWALVDLGTLLMDKRRDINGATDAYRKVLEIDAHHPRADEIRSVLSARSSQGK